MSEGAKSVLDTTSGQQAETLIQECSPGQYKVLGRLTVDTVAAYQVKGFDAIQRSQQGVTFDLANTEVHGSAVIALLVSWERKAFELEKPISIINASQHLLEIADVSGVKDIISFAAEQ